MYSEDDLRYPRFVRCGEEPGARSLLDLARAWRRLLSLLVAIVAIAVGVPPASAADLIWPPITAPATDRWVPGRWVWTELFSEDADRAERFYREAFDWNFQVFPAARGSSYLLGLADGDPVGGILQRAHAFEKTPGSRWLGMLSVEDVAATARRAAERGGRVLVPPRLLEGRGEVALLADPEGAPFGVIRAAGGDPADYLAEDRQWVWIELWARRPEDTARFYADLVGYEIAPVERPDGRTAYFLAKGGFTRCAVIPSPAADLQPAWLPYLRIADVRQAVSRAQAAGARVMVAPSPAVRDGRVALLLDPTGAALGLAEVRGGGDDAPH